MKIEKTNEDIVYDLVNSQPSCMKGIEYTEDDAELVRTLVEKQNYDYQQAIDRVLDGIAECLDMEF